MKEPSRGAAQMAALCAVQAAVGAVACLVRVGSGAAPDVLDAMQKAAESLLYVKRVAEDYNKRSTDQKNPAVADAPVQ